MNSVIAKLNASYPEGFNAAVKAGILNSEKRFVAISHADCAYSLKMSIESVERFFGNDWSPGDVAVLNDPNQGATHVAQLTVVAPRFAGGIIDGWVVARTNIPDLGGWLIGGYSPDAVDRWAEAARFVPAKILLSGKPRREVLDLLSLNSRTPQATRKFALAVSEAALELAGLEHAGSHQQLYEAESARLSDLLSPLAGKQAESTKQVPVPEKWGDSELTIKATVVVAKKGIHVQVAAPQRSAYPLNLAEATSQDIVISALMAALGRDDDQTDALAAITDIQINGELLAAPMEACVGIGRETSGAAVFEAVMAAMSRLLDAKPQCEASVQRWLNREVLAPVDWNTGALPPECLERLLAIESEIAR